MERIAGRLYYRSTSRVLLPTTTMNSFVRPLRTTFNRSPLAARHRLAVRPVSPLLHHARTAASYPGLKPGSQDLAHAKQNIKEEASNSAADLAKAIAGANIQGDGVKSGFVRRLARDLPFPF